MKNVGLTFGLLMLVICAHSQITISNTSFPVIGDKLKMVENFNLTGNLNMGPVNGPQTWDFSSLNQGRLYEENYKDGKSGTDAAAFPDANLLVDIDGQVQYLKSSSSKIEVVGIGGANDFIDAPITIRYSKRPNLRIAPLNFINSTSSESEFRIDIGAKILPDSLLALIPIAFDSIRIQFANSSKGVVDAYGTLKMQSKEFPVLREKVETNSETKVFLKIFGLWIDPLPLLGGNIPGGFENLLGKDTTITYNFYTNTKKEILVSAEYDLRNNLQVVNFADVGGVLSSTSEYNAPNFTVYPNPTSDVLRIQTPNWKKGVYLISILDISGRTLYAEPSELQENLNKEINISAFEKGVYILTVRDKFNTFTSSAKFVIK